MNRILDRLESKFSKYALKNFFIYIVATTAFVFLFDAMGFTIRELPLRYWLGFNRELIFQGQIWRILSFICVPYSFVNLISTALSLYCYWLIAGILERYWGSFRFNVFYFTGLIGAIIAGFITGNTTAYFLNMSLFLALALIQPNAQFLLFFVLPVKAWWLAVVDAVYIIYLLVLDFSMWPVVLFSLVNIALFFGKQGFTTIQSSIRRSQWKKNFK